MARTFALMFVLLAVACGGTSGQTVWDVSEPGPGDIQLPDTCACQTDKECDGKVAVDQCTFAKCDKCACVARPKPASTPCDDKDQTTVGDVCDDKGKCAGHKPVPYDGKCEAPVENCDTMPNDCPCPSGKICNEGSCIPKPVCGNGKCEPTEDCAGCPRDCGCGAGKHCAVKDRKCIPCADWCKAEGRECGEDEGCNCGQCKPGELCTTEGGTCYNAPSCGSGKCDNGQNGTNNLGEDCSTCPSDCTCPDGKGCEKGQCVDCQKLCDAVGMECGTLGTCICGPCQEGYKCKANKCMPNCDWLCYGKQCGEVDGCKCGDLKGECPQGEECVKGMCLKECGILCEGKECGWGEDCFCAFCSGCDACHNNKCGPGAEADANEPNNTPETATDLGSTTDDDVQSARQVTGSIHDGDDIDWFKIKVKDTGLFNALTPVLDMTGLAEDKDLVLMICYKCDKGDLAGAEVLPSDTTYEVDPQVPGARCFETFNWWGESDHIELHPVCKSGGQDDSGTLYIAIYPYEWLDCGSGYTLDMHM